MKKNIQFNRAFALVETLVAISIFTFSILGLMSVLASGVIDTNYAKQKMTATFLAQEGIEYARNVRDTYVLYNSTSSQVGWENFRDANVSIVELPLPTEFNDSYVRIMEKNVIKNVINVDEVEIVSSVSWTQGSGDYSVTSSEHLFNWIE